jgi:hypothetical protein
MNPDHAVELRSYTTWWDVTRRSLLQLTVPDKLRGRATSINYLVDVAGPQLGEFEAGALAELTNPRLSVTAGGLACLLGLVAIAQRMHRLEHTEKLNAAATVLAGRIADPRTLVHPRSPDRAEAIDSPAIE